jgi:hypothetical protein
VCAFRVLLRFEYLLVIHIPLVLTATFIPLARARQPSRPLIAE